MKVTKRSALTGTEHTLELDVTQAQLDRHAAGEFVQDVFPALNADVREFLISGITGEEWTAFFGSDPDGDEDGDVVDPELDAAWEAAVNSATDCE